MTDVPAVSEERTKPFFFFFLCVICGLPDEEVVSWSLSPSLPSSVEPDGPGQLELMWRCCLRRRRDLCDLNMFWSTNSLAPFFTKRSVTGTRTRTHTKKQQEHDKRPHRRRHRLQTVWSERAIEDKPLTGSSRHHTVQFPYGSPYFSSCKRWVSPEKLREQRQTYYHLLYTMMHITVLKCHNAIIMHL